MNGFEPPDDHCPGCGIDMEVIGPPGPQHRAGCCYKEAKDTSRSVTDAEVAAVFNDLNDPPALMNDPALIEKLADIEHARWAGWMEYLFSKSTITPAGDCVIPKGLVDRWQRQVKTRYADLSEREKESDRDEVRKTLAVLSGKAR